MKNREIRILAGIGLVLGVCAFLVLRGLNLRAVAAGTTDPAAFASEPRAVSAEAGEAVGLGKPILEGEELFSFRDLEQSPDLSRAVTLTVSDGQSLSIDEEGVYLLRGTARDASVIVEAEKTAKVQLVLDGLRIENEDIPCISVRSADKVFVSTVADSSLSVTGSFAADGDEDAAVIFSRDDLVLNGTGTLTISSCGSGVSSRDDLKITGGGFVIRAASKCLEARDSIRIAGGSFALTAGSDALHAENDKDESLGYIYIGEGGFSIDAQDDGVHAGSFVQIDGGSLSIRAGEGIEATAVQLNGGRIDMDCRDDGINAARKSGAYQPLVEINGGELTIRMGPGDTDGIDSNGDIVVNGGSIDITGPSGFDYEGSAVHNGGSIVVNGQTLDRIPNQMMGGPGGMGGRPGGPGEGRGGDHGGGPGGPGDPPERRG